MKFKQHLLSAELVAASMAMGVSTALAACATGVLTLLDSIYGAFFKKQGG